MMSAMELWRALQGRIRSVTSPGLITQIRETFRRTGNGCSSMREGDGGGPNYSIFMRKTDGSPPARLGEGLGMGLSADGNWAISVLPSTPSQIVLLPTGPGSPKKVNRFNIDDYGLADFFPDGKRILFSGTEAGHAMRDYVQD